MRVLILGARGNLGQQLVRLYTNESEVISWDHDQVDITDTELITNKIAEVNPSLIINAAAYNAVDKCEGDDAEFEIAKKINGFAPGIIAKAAQEIGAIFVHYSSDYVFDGVCNKGYKELDTPKPINRYGETKLLGEKEILKHSGNGLKWYVIRVSKLFGPKGGSEKAKENFFDIMLRLSEEKEELRIVDEEVSCFTYTPDLAAATKSLINQKCRNGIYHLANMAPCTWFEAAEELFRQARVDKKIIPIASTEYPRPAKRPKHSVLLNTKTLQLRSYKDALRDYLRSVLI